MLTRLHVHQARIQSPVPRAKAGLVLWKLLAQPGAPVRGRFPEEVTSEQRPENRRQPERAQSRPSRWRKSLHKYQDGKLACVLWYTLPLQGKDAREAPGYQGRDSVVVSCRSVLKNLVLVSEEWGASEGFYSHTVKSPILIVHFTKFRRRDTAL